MTSYLGDNTAKQRQADRIDARARKDRGRGATPATNTVNVDPKEARKFVPKHHFGDFTPATMTALDQWLTADRDRAERGGFPPPVGITAFQFRWFVAEGIIPGAFDPGSREQLLQQGIKPTPVRIAITSNTGLVGDIDVTARGFFSPTGGAPGMPIYSLSVLVAPIFAIRFKWDHIASRMLVG